MIVDSEVGAVRIELEDGHGNSVMCPGFFFGLVPTDADTYLTDATPRSTYGDYMIRAGTAAVFC